MAVFERMLTGNMRDLVEEHFESPAVRACFIDAQDAGDPRAPGSVMACAYIRSDILTPHENFGIPRGGMGAITQAMARSAEAQGVEIRTDAAVARILTHNGAASGVLLADGERIAADAVLSNADPKRTFLSLLDAADAPPALLADARRMKTNTSYLKFHCAMSELPDFSAYLGAGYDAKALAYIRICPSVEYFEQNWDDARNGKPSSCPVMYIQIPTVYDDTLTPHGKHVMSVWVMYAPVRLAQGSWQDARQEVGERLIDTIAQYAPNFRDGTAGLGALHARGVGRARGIDGRQYTALGYDFAAVVRAASKSGACGLSHADSGAVYVRRGGASGRRGYGGAGGITPRRRYCAIGNRPKRKGARA